MIAFDSLPEPPNPTEFDRLRDENAELVIRLMELETENAGLREELKGFRWGHCRVGTEGQHQ